MSAPTARLAALGLTLPEVAAPLAAYLPATVVGDQVWTSGQLPLVEGTLPLTGPVGGDVTAEQGAEMARLCALNGLAAAASVAGGLDRIGRVLKAVVYVASVPGFTGQPAVGNGASQLLGDVFGEAGVHVRSAVGVAVLPLGAPVEVELVLQLAG